MRKLNFDTAPHLVEVALIRVKLTIYNALMAIYLKWWGVKCGSKPEFFGPLFVRRHPNSKISIGDSCRFRSSLWANLAGANHRCMISTLADNAKILIGRDCGFSGCVIAAQDSIVIGDRVTVGVNTIISDTD